MFGVFLFFFFFVGGSCFHVLPCLGWHCEKFFKDSFIPFREVHRLYQFFRSTKREEKTPNSKKGSQDQPTSFVGSFTFIARNINSIYEKLKATWSNSQIIILIPERTLDIDLPFCCASLVVGGHGKAAS